MTNININKTGLSYDEAMKCLRVYKPTTKISRIYDNGIVSDAILTLLPNFEYPDWSHKSINEFLNYAKEYYKLSS